MGNGVEEESVPRSGPGPLRGSSPKPVGVAGGGIGSGSGELLGKYNKMFSQESKYYSALFFILCIDTVVHVDGSMKKIIQS